MILNHAPDVRKAVTAALNDGQAGDLATIYGEAIPSSPARPHVSVGFILPRPKEEWTCNGIFGDFAVSTWADGETALLAYNIAHAVQYDLHLKKFPLENGGIIHSLRWLNATPAFPTEARAKWRVISQFTFATSE